MIFKKENSIGCLVIDILCVFVLVSSCCVVTADVDFNALDGEILYSYYTSAPFEDTLNAGDNNCGCGGTHCPLTGFNFKDIDSVDKIYWLEFDFVCGFGHATEEVMSDQENFVITCSGHEVGSGIAVVQYEKGTVRLYFDGDIQHHGLEGFQACTITGTCPDGLNFSLPDSGCCYGGGVGQSTVWYAGGITVASEFHDFAFSDLLTGGSPGITDHDITYSYGTYWQNNLKWVTVPMFGHDFTRVNVTRNFSGSTYESKVEVVAGSESWDNEDFINLSFFVYDRPIDVSIEDTLDIWHNCTLFSGAVTVDSIFGYVRDAEYGYLLSGVEINLSIACDDFETGADGKYAFGGLEFGTAASFLNASKLDYENFSLETVLIDGARYDIALVGNVTVYDGTATVYGFVRDYETMSLIPNSLVRILGNETDLSTYSNEYGFFRFYNVTGIGTHVLSGQKLGYEPGSVAVNVSVLNAKYSATILLLNESSLATPDPGDEDEDEPYNPILILIEALGLGDYFGWIMAIIIICVLAAVMSYLTGGSALATGIGALFGFLISCFAGFLPMWLIAIAILGSCAFFASMVMKGR